MSVTQVSLVNFFFSSSPQTHNFHQATLVSNQLILPSPTPFYVTNETTSSKMTNMVQPKADKIEETRANLPLPDQPPVASDWQSADASKVNVSSGRTEGNIGTDSAAQSGLREPATKGSDADLSNVGREGKDNLSGPPKDAAA